MAVDDGMNVVNCIYPIVVALQHEDCKEIHDERSNLCFDALRNRVDINTFSDGCMTIRHGQWHIASQQAERVSTVMDAIA
jgi:hypothetical protein